MHAHHLKHLEDKPAINPPPKQVSVKPEISIPFVRKRLHSISNSLTISALNEKIENNL